MTHESWRPVRGWEGYYEASNLGQVRSLDRWVKAYTGRRLARGQVLAPRLSRHGYYLVQLSRDGRKVHKRVHALVLEAFVGTGPEGYVCLHRDNNRINNNLDNLRWGSLSENIIQSVTDGTHYNASAVQCPQGHAYNERNTYIHPVLGHRGCRRCRADREQKRRDRLREVGAA